MRNNNFFKFLLLLAGVLVIVSCDKDYSEVGDALIGENHFDLDKDVSKTVQTSSKYTGAIASKNLAINALGVLDNSAFGKTTSNFATQVELATVNPTIDPALGQQVQSVILYIPYFINKTIGINPSNGRPIYTLDSIYGNKDAKLKLRIYENKHVLDNNNTDGPLDPEGNPQLYYTDQDGEFNDKKGTWLNDSTDPAENSAFGFSPSEYVITNADATTTYVAPGMRLNLNKTFFQNLLLSGKLSANDVFREYFKGLYFNVEKADAEGVLAMMNFKKGIITINYKEKTSSTDNTLLDKSITLNLTGNTVSLLANDFSSSGIEYSSNQQSGRLYLRGGEGSVGIIDLFGSTDVVTYNRTTKKIESGSNGIPDELDDIKAKGWLINEASLTFYIDQAAMNGVEEPNRIFVYDLTNKMGLLDYYYDGTTSFYPNYEKRVYGGIIQKEGGKGVKYKVQITSYLRDVINNDRKNVKLGVSVSQSISNVNFSKQKSAPLYDVWKGLEQIEKNAYYFPEASVMNPLGTILYGSNASDDTKRLKLEIYYTKPN